jgi:3-hydroxyacyl-CoA dehydrogenase
VFERIPVKEEVFKKLDAVMKPGALLYANTSGIDIMANATKRPQDVAGRHFFAPANDGKEASAEKIAVPS